MEPRLNEVCQGTREIGSLIEVLLHTFKKPCWRISFVIPKTLLYRGSLNRGCTLPPLFVIFAGCRSSGPDQPPSSQVDSEVPWARLSAAEHWIRKVDWRGNEGCVGRLRGGKVWKARYVDEGCMTNLLLLLFTIFRLHLIQSRIHVIKLNKWAAYISRLIRRINKEMN